MAVDERVHSSIFLAPDGRLTGEFWRRVRYPSDDACWEWTGTRNRKGYGTIYLPTGRRTVVHRLVWEERRGPIPDGMSVLHHCDNPPCVNPRHLFLGDHSDNGKDAGRKGRLGHQKQNKLNPTTVRDIRARLATGEPQGRIATEYGVSRTLICNINTGYAWGWLS